VATGDAEEREPLLFWRKQGLGAFAEINERSRRDRREIEEINEIRD
jgi:hypothetical protein